MDAQKMKAPKKVYNKDGYIVSFEDKVPFWERLKGKVFSTYFLTNVVWYIFRLVLMIGISFVILYPFISKIAGSFMAPEDFKDATVNIIPKHFTIGTYKAIFLENHYMSAFVNTLLLSLLCALLQTFICCLVGYGLAKFKFKGNKLILLMVVLTMIIPHGTLRLSMFLHFEYFNPGSISGWNVPGILTPFIWFINLFRSTPLTGVSLTDTYWPLILLSLFGLGFKNGLYIFMMRQFFHGVPDELEESAYVDGSTTMRTFFQIIIPLSIPMMITIFLFAFSWQWTDNFYTELFFISGSDIILMPDLLESVPPTLLANKPFTDWSLYETAIRNTCGLMIILPLVILYLFCQKYLVQGIERSGIVG